MVESQAELLLPATPTEEAPANEVQLLAYQRLPHRTRAAAGLLQSAFLELQVRRGIWEPAILLCCSLFYGTWSLSDSYSLIVVGSGVHCLSILLL